MSSHQKARQHLLKSKAICQPPTRQPCASSWVTARGRGEFPRGPTAPDSHRKAGFSSEGLIRGGKTCQQHSRCFADNPLPAGKEGNRGKVPGRRLPAKSQELSEARAGVRKDTPITRLHPAAQAHRRTLPSWLCLLLLPAGPCTAGSSSVHTQEREGWGTELTCSALCPPERCRPQPRRGEGEGKP